MGGRRAFFWPADFSTLDFSGRRPNDGNERATAQIRRLEASHKNQICGNPSGVLLSENCSTLPQEVDNEKILCRLIGSGRRLVLALMCPPCCTAR